MTKMIETLGFPIACATVLLVLVVWIIKAMFKHFERRAEKSDSLFCELKKAMVEMKDEFKDVLRKEIGYPLQALLMVEKIKQDRPGSSQKIKEAVEKTIAEMVPSEGGK